MRETFLNRDEKIVQNRQIQVIFNLITFLMTDFNWNNYPMQTSVNRTKALVASQVTKSRFLKGNVRRMLNVFVKSLNLLRVG